MHDLSRVEGFMRLQRRIIARRADAYRVQSSALRTGVNEFGSVPFSMKAGYGIIGVGITNRETSVPL
jgi:hypothetical protein